MAVDFLHTCRMQIHSPGTEDPSTPAACMHESWAKLLNWAWLKREVARGKLRNLEELGHYQPISVQLASALLDTAEIEAGRFDHWCRAYFYPSPSVVIT